MPRSGKRRGEGEDLEMADRDGEVREGLLEGGLGEEEEVRVRNWANIGKKWFTDCITFGALFNTTAFLVIMGVLKHKSSAQIGEYSPLLLLYFPLSSALSSKTKQSTKQSKAAKKENPDFALLCSDIALFA